MNPSKFRNICKLDMFCRYLSSQISVDGKLMFILMDTESHTVKNELNLNFKMPIQTVREFLAEKNALNILTDELFPQATASIENDRGLKSREVVHNELNVKSAAGEKLMQKYCTGSPIIVAVSRV